jgi:hypothetical protein
LVKKNCTKHATGIISIRHGTDACLDSFLRKFYVERVVMIWSLLMYKEDPLWKWVRRTASLSLLTINSHLSVPVIMVTVTLAMMVALVAVAVMVIVVIVVAMVAVVGARRGLTTLRGCLHGLIWTSRITAETCKPDGRTFGPAALHRGKRAHAPRETLGICFALSNCGTLDARGERQEHSDEYEEDEQKFLHLSWVVCFLEYVASCDEHALTSGRVKERLVRRCEPWKKSKWGWEFMRRGIYVGSSEPSHQPFFFDAS